MARVYMSVKSKRATKQPYRCTHCSKVIGPGEKYYYWQRYDSPVRYRHVICGYPRHSELSGAKTAPLLDAVEDAQKEIEEWGRSIEVEFIAGVEGADPHFAITDEPSVTDLSGTLENIAEQAREVADEYEESADNMPENLQYGTQAEAMRDVASRLQEWADEIEGVDAGDDPDWPELPDDFGPEHPDYQTIMDQAQAAAESWAENIRSDASDKVPADVPEYEG